MPPKFRNPKSPHDGLVGMDRELRNRNPATDSIGKRILVVDDEKSMRIIASRILETAGHQVETAKNGEEGFEIWKAGGFDLVISDVVMHGMDGHGLLRAIRELDPDARVVMMSGTADDIERMELLREGATEFIGKPFSDTVLRGIVDKVLARANIIVVDANRGVSEITVKILRREGYDRPFAPFPRPEPGLRAPGWP